MANVCVRLENLKKLLTLKKHLLVKIIVSNVFNKRLSSFYKLVAANFVWRPGAKSK